MDSVCNDRCRPLRNAPRPRAASTAADNQIDGNVRTGILLRTQPRNYQVSENRFRDTAIGRQAGAKAKARAKAKANGTAPARSHIDLADDTSGIRILGN